MLVRSVVDYNEKIYEIYPKSIIVLRCSSDHDDMVRKIIMKVIIKIISMNEIGVVLMKILINDEDNGNEINKFIDDSNDNNNNNNNNNKIIIIINNS